MKRVEQLKARLGKGSSFELRWEACNTYKSDNKTDKELIWRVISERYNTIQTIVVLHKSGKGNSYTQSIMVSDHTNTERIEVRVNGYKYPQEDFKCDFSDANEDYSNTYQQFLQLGYKSKNADCGSIVRTEVTMILKQYIFYFVLMFQSMNQISIEIDQLLIKKLNCTFLKKKNILTFITYKKVSRF